MKILIIHEIDWEKKVVFEPHHFAELFSLLGHDVFVIDCPAPDSGNIVKGLKTETLENYNRVYDNARITLIRPGSLRIKGLNRLVQFFSCKKEIERILLEEKIEIVLLYGVATNGIQTIKLCKKHGVPVVFRALDVAHALVTIPVLKNLARKYEKTVISNASEVLTTTKDMKKYAVSMGAKDELVADFPLGVNLDTFKPLVREKPLEQKLGISNEKIISFMGTLYPFSGLVNILENFETIEKDSPVKLLIIGGGPSLNSLKQMTKNLHLDSKVIFTDFVPQNQIPRYLALSDLCLNPFEINYVTNNIIPTKILEYFACRKPVLSTPLEGTRNLLPDENYGIVYSDSANYVKNIVNILNNPKKMDELADNGFKYVTANHDWEKISSSLIEKFEKLLSSKGR